MVELKLLRSCDWLQIVEAIKKYCISYSNNLKIRDVEDECDKEARILIEKNKRIFLETLALEPNPKITRRLSQNNPNIAPDTKKAKIFYDRLYDKFESTFVDEFVGFCNDNPKPELPEGFSKNEIKESIKKLRNNISPGPLGITAMFLKKFKKLVAWLLEAEFNDFLRSNKIDDYWKQGRISLIPKKGDLKEIENWRPICVLNIEWKIFTGLVNKVMYNAWEKEMGDSQIGFRKGRWIHENHLLLQAILRNGWAKRNKKKTKNKSSGWLIFIDFKKAL